MYFFRDSKGKAMAEQGFLSDIRQYPNDDWPRLIYTDWLEDHGRPERAELIRAQIRLSSRTARTPGIQSLRVRQNQLLDSIEMGNETNAFFAETGLPVTGLGVKAVRYRRGMPEELILGAGYPIGTELEKLVDAGIRSLAFASGELAVRQPVPDRVASPMELTDLACSPETQAALRRIERLRFDNVNDAGFFQQLTALPLDNLRLLALSSTLNEGGINCQEFAEGLGHLLDSGKFAGRTMICVDSRIILSRALRERLNAHNDAVPAPVKQSIASIYRDYGEQETHLPQTFRLLTRSYNFAGESEGRAPTMAH